MWHAGHPAAEQCEGCTWVTTQVTELSYLHSRDITFAVFCQGPYAQSARYREFMGWDMPWYSAQDSLDALLTGRQIGLFHLVSYVRDGDRVFETYWTKRRGAEAMDYSYALMDLHRVRTPGAVGGLASRLAAAVLHHPDRRRPARLAASVSVAGRAPHRPVAATPSRTLRRPRHRRALTGGGRPDDEAGLVAAVPASSPVRYAAVRPGRRGRRGHGGPRLAATTRRRQQ